MQLSCSDNLISVSKTNEQMNKFHYQCLKIVFKNQIKSTKKNRLHICSSRSDNLISVFKTNCEAQISLSMFEKNLKIFQQ